MTFADIVSKIDGIVWGWAMIVVLVGTHIFMTVRTGVIQRHLIKGIKLSVSKDEGSGEGEISQYGALTTALAATIGTGNIVGVATAVISGGPGRYPVDVAHRYIRYGYQVLGNAHVA